MKCSLLKGKRMTIKRSTVMRQMVKADVSLDNSDGKPATWQPMLFFQATSSHRYLPMYTRSAHPDYRQVHAHQKIGHAKLRDKHVKSQLPHTGMKTETIDEASQVPQEGQHSENGENDTVQVRP